jgi:hypothetical protein
MRIAVALVLLVLSLGFAAGCAGDDEPDQSETAAWAETFCTATLDWTNELRRIADDLGNLASLSSASIEQASEEARAATDEFTAEVRDLGSPGTEGGDEIESSLETLADDVDGEAEEIEDALEDLDGLAGLATAGREVAASVSAMFVSLERVFETVDSADPAGELQTAFEETDACDEITN